MTQKDTLSAIRPSAPRPSAPNPLDIATGMLPLFQHALDHDGFKHVGPPSDEQLAGAITFELPRFLTGTTATLYGTRDGALVVRHHGQGQAETWRMVRPEFVRDFFAVTLATWERIPVLRPVNAERHAAFDVSPPPGDVVARICTIKQHTYLSITGSGSDERWFRLEARAHQSLWLLQ